MPRADSPGFPTGARGKPSESSTGAWRNSTAAPGRPQHGRKTQPWRGVPFFWTEQFDQTLQYVGYASSWDEIIFEGDLMERKFLAFYVRDNRVLATAGLGFDREMTAVAELMRLDHLPTPEELRQGAVDLVERLRQLT